MFAKVIIDINKEIRMRHKRPVVTSLDEAWVERHEPFAYVHYRDPRIRSVRIDMGSGVEEMADEDIIALHNRMIEARQEMRDGLEYTAVEVPEGEEQIAYHPLADQWSPRGGVLRCEIGTDDLDTPVFYIDDHELSLREFGRMMTVYAGWGVRIVFVPDDELTAEPSIVVGDPEKHKAVATEPSKKYAWLDKFLTVDFPRLDSPSLGQILDEFMAAEKNRVSPATSRKNAEVVELMRSYLNGYGPSFLYGAEKARFKAICGRKGVRPITFCDLYGAEMMPVCPWAFLFDYMLEKEAAGMQQLRRAAKVVQRLFAWMGEREYISLETADDGIAVGQTAYIMLPRAEKVATILYDYASRCPVDPNSLEDQDFLEFDHYTVERVEPCRIWLDSYDEDVGMIGPVPVPEEASKLIVRGWEIGCAMGRHEGKWMLMETGNVHVYPE